MLNFRKFSYNLDFKIFCHLKLQIKQISLLYVCIYSQDKLEKVTNNRIAEILNIVSFYLQYLSYPYQCI